MTGFTGGDIAAHTRFTCAFPILGDDIVTTACPDMFLRDMAVGAGKVEARFIHVHVQLPVWVDQAGVQVTVFDSVTAAPVEVASTAVLAGGQCRALRHLGPVNGLLALEHHRAGFTAGRIRRLVIGSAAVVANHTVDIVLVGEIESFIFPSVPGVTLGAFIGSTLTVSMSERTFRKMVSIALILIGSTVVSLFAASKITKPLRVIEDPRQDAVRA